MAKMKIFISSVQSEFAKERMELHDYLLSDPLLGKFFEPFIFELLPAMDTKVNKVYLQEVEKSDIYIGLLGTGYGFEDQEGISPTEREFDHATLHHKTRLVYLTKKDAKDRNEKQNRFIAKAQSVVVRKHFSNSHELKYAVYASLVRYLEEKEIIRTGPFDATFFATASLKDISKKKISDFVQLARSKRGSPLKETSSIEEVLSHLNLMDEGKITNAAILLFASEPQQFFINSELRCAVFKGTSVEKPIPSYKVFKGDVFELVEQAVDFILSKLDYSIETRKDAVQIPGKYEIPREIIAEAVVNAVVHRDYTSNASVQVMLFKDRLEIWNPGSLPLGWTTEKLKLLHSSVPANPLLAEPMYLTGYIERLGTGTSDIVRIAKESGLDEPQFVQDDSFKIIVHRPKVTTGQATGQATGQVTGQVTLKATLHANDSIKQLVNVMHEEMKRAEIMEALELSHRENFMSNYLEPAINGGYVELTYPNNPNHPKQKYRLTIEGEELKKQL